MIIMVCGHLIDWWLTEEDYWLFLLLWSIFAAIGAGGFLFISGTVTALSYKNRILQEKDSNNEKMDFMRNTYIFRALLLLAIAFIYNTIIAIAINDLTWIWAWFVLQTIGFALLMAWPFLKSSKLFRILFAIIILIANYILLDLLLPYKGQVNLYGILFHILYNPVILYPILPFFSIFLFGTVVGDILFEINQIEDQNARNLILKQKFIRPLFLVGVLITIFSIFFYFPSFFQYPSFSAMVYALGINLIIISLLIGIEEFKGFKLEKIYTFFFYYSYYSFTIFLAHNPLYFLFNRQLNIFTIWVAVIISMVFITLLLNLVYKKLGPKASLKVGISVLSYILATKIEHKKLKKKEKNSNC